jgi:EVE domain
MTKHWIVVASAEHVRRGLAGGFIQAGHGKEAPLRRMKRGDGLICYSPTETMGGKDRLQTFTAIGFVKDDNIYAVDMTPGFRPFRRDVMFWQSEPTPIAPLLDALTLTRGHRHWGAKFRFGLVEISHSDFKKIANAMGVQTADDGGQTGEDMR